MELDKISSYQLYELIKNSNLDNEIRALANLEFRSRRLSFGQMRQIIIKHDTMFPTLKDGPLDDHIKTLLLLFPFAMPKRITGSTYLLNGQKRKYKDYWIFVCLGYLLWTIGIILYARFFRRP